MKPDFFAFDPVYHLEQSAVLMHGDTRLPTTGTLASHAPAFHR
jgi:hypothetical protein